MALPCISSKNWQSVYKVETALPCIRSNRWESINKVESALFNEEAFTRLNCSESFPFYEEA